MTHMPGYPCAVCHRESRGFSLSVPNLEVQQFCSANCMRTYMLNRGDLRPNERKAVQTAGNAAGAYLERIGKFDLRTLTEEEWITFCGTVFSEACAALKTQADDEIPF